MRTYEVLIIFGENVRDENIDAAMDVFQTEVERQGGTVLDRFALGRRTFARPQGKRDSGFYGRVYLQMPPDNIAELRRRFKFIDEVFRMQITLMPKGYSKAKDETRADDSPAITAADADKEA